MRPDKWPCEKAWARWLSLDDAAALVPGVRLGGHAEARKYAGLRRGLGKRPPELISETNTG